MMSKCDKTDKNVQMLVLRFSSPWKKRQIKQSLKAYCDAVGPRMEDTGGKSLPAAKHQHNTQHTPQGGMNLTVE